LNLNFETQKENKKTRALRLKQKTHKEHREKETHNVIEFLLGKSKTPKFFSGILLNSI